ncbi:GntR family transcriptional regulator [Puniceibacterium sp. IMCC21224]|uniref:GntR family transcriptional regulator n=1 Tax=Puniceibacterium sp. IMCC21224 TaxID=1618204 RepID=UPI00064D860D|nr:GntR family transcriptional regulator [Puniceibacterium sp. IMCC21224]KMK68642.1 transcriptional regulator, GntR family [Puniceibacterium sp. IMCC21224]
MSDAIDRFQRLHMTLRDRICLLDYPPGAKLSEESLAAEFGTSRTPLRRVLARLETEGLVISRHGVGTIVTDVDIVEMAQVYDLRLELAQLVGVLSPCLITPDIITTGAEFVARGTALARAPAARAFARLNMEFHDFGLTLTTNAALRDTAQQLYLRTTRIWLKAIPQMDLARETEIFLDEMRQTHGALESGDMRAAALIRKAHISMSFHRLSGF